MYRAALPLIACATVAHAQVPLPASVQTASGKFTFKADDAIQANGAAAALEAEKFVTSFRQASGLALKVGTTPARIRVNIDESVKSNAGEEGYQLQVTPQFIQLTAATGEGLYHGLQSLRQLLPPAAFSTQPVKGVEWSIGCVKIDDQPRFGWRGFMLDESRHFFGPEYVKHLLDAMAARKLNVFHWHLSDDDGWRIEIKSWPKLTEVGAWRGTECAIPNTRQGETHKRYGGFYTQEQIKEIVAYAAERHIDILPEIDLPGHCLAVTTAYPETLPSVLDGAVSAQGVSANVISPAKDVSYKLVDDVMRELSGLFPFPYVHIGGDEVNHATWSKCPEIKALMAREKLPNLGAVQNYFTGRLETILGKYQRRVIGWNEILHGGKLRQDTTVMAWTGTGPGIEAAKHGHPVIMSAGPYLYFDMGYGGPNEPRTHGWAGNVDTSKTYSFDPVGEGDLTEDQRKLILGPHAALWSEYAITAEDADYRIFPRLNALAEVGWTPQAKRSWEDFSRRLGADLERLRYQGVAFRVPPPTAQWKDGKATLIPPYPGADLRFTTDGSKPTASSPRYTGPFAIENPEKLQYLTVFHDRTSPAKVGAERDAFAKWNSKLVTTEWKSAEFDATSVITGDGVYRAGFQFSNGSSRLLIRKVELLRDGQAVATDAHDGEAGGRHVKNLYRLPVSGHRRGAKYSLRVEIRADGSKDSSGGISIERSTTLEPAMNVTTEVPHHADRSVEQLATWQPGGFFWSNRPMKEGDSVTFTFDQALSLRSVEVPTGEPNGTKDQILNAVLEVSADGKSFRKVADYAYGTAKAELKGSSVKAIRLRVTGANSTWCIVRAPQLR